MKKAGNGEVFLRAHLALVGVPLQKFALYERLYALFDDGRVGLEARAELARDLNF